MQTNQEYKLWLERADDNLKWAEGGLGDGFYPLTCFLSQQAVELALKGYLYFKRVVSPKSHDLPEILLECWKNGLKLGNKMSIQIERLSEYYLKSRYPDTMDEKLDNKSVAEEALKFAKEIVKKVKSSFNL